LATALKQGKLEAPMIAKLTKQLTTLNRRASEAAVEHGVRAATDITGFGLIGHASQLADASGVTVRLAPRPEWFLPRVLDLALAGAVAAGLYKNRDFYAEKVDGKAASEAMDLALYDPQTAGGLLLSVPARREAALIGALRRRRVFVMPVGEVVARGARAVELR